MRLWSLHPRYLDSKGLVALWREGLLAQEVLAGRTLGYRHHPQLERFKRRRNPLQALGFYLFFIHQEAKRRGYRFNLAKIDQVPRYRVVQLTVSRGQLRFEWEHLRRKLKARNPRHLRALEEIVIVKPNPCFRVVSGGVSPWERQNLLKTPD